MATARPKLNEPADAAMPGTRSRLLAQGTIPVGADGLNFGGGGALIPPFAINAGQSTVSVVLDLRGFSSFTIAGNALAQNLDLTLEIVDGAEAFGTVRGVITFGTLVAGANTVLQKSGVVWPTILLRVKNNTGGNATLNYLTGLYCSA